MTPVTGQIIARRIGRITFGVVLLAGVACLLAAASSGLRGAPWILGAKDFNAARIITQTWLFAVTAGVVAWRVALRMRFAANPDRLFAESVLVPAVGIALLLPITLHMPVVLALGDSSAFDTWVVASLWITGVAHAVFAITIALRGYQLVAGKPAWSPRSIYFATLVTSCVPFVVLYAIPPALVAITALPFVPLLRAMERIVARERAELAVASHVLPRAIARPGSGTRPAARARPLGVRSRPDPRVI